MKFKKKQNTKLVPNIPLVPIAEGVEKKLSITYYEGKYPQACKSCLVKKNADLSYTMKLRRNGSAYCQGCADEFISGLIGESVV